MCAHIHAHTEAWECGSEWQGTLTGCLLQEASPDLTLGWAPTTYPSSWDACAPSWLAVRGVPLLPGGRHCGMSISLKADGTLKKSSVLPARGGGSESLTCEHHTVPGRGGSP